MLNQKDYNRELTIRDANTDMFYKQLCLQHIWEKIFKNKKYNEEKLINFLYKNHENSFWLVISVFNELGICSDSKEKNYHEIDNHIKGNYKSVLESIINYLCSKE